jgi:hypothetical protein
MLASLSRVNGIGAWHLYIGLEPGNEACQQLCEQISFMPKTILYNAEKLGVRGNPFQVLQHAFAAGSEINIHLEDDLLVSPDICELALWYYELVPETQLHDIRIFFLNLFVCSTGREAKDALTVSSFFSPWGMMMNRYQWTQLMAPQWWNDEHNYPQQYDWTLSLSHLMNQHRDLLVLAPLLSRTTNIGRDGGVHSFPERHDMLLDGLVMHTGQESVAYRLDPRAAVPWRKPNYKSMTVQDEWRESPITS